jgi:phosphonate transport system substrate-binding protein
MRIKSGGGAGKGIDRGNGLTRRAVLALGMAAALVAPRVVRTAQSGPVTFGLTPVFLDSDIQLLAMLRGYLERRLDHAVTLVKRRTYQEITGLLLSGELDAAWICGFPLIQYPEQLALLAVPVYHGRPLYQSYVIVHKGNAAQSFADLRGTVHAFSDPDSNSGFLVTRHLLATMSERPETFFRRTFFTYGHRDVIRAVSSGLADGGSVDGYVWDVVSEIEPALTDGTRVIRKSEPLGFPPIACNARRRPEPIVQAITDALVTMADDAGGRELLHVLRLDGFSAEDIRLFDAIAQKYRIVQSQT